MAFGGNPLDTEDELHKDCDPDDPSALELDQDCQDGEVPIPVPTDEGATSAGADFSQDQMEGPLVSWAYVQFACVNRKVTEPQ